MRSRPILALFATILPAFLPGITGGRVLAQAAPATAPASRPAAAVPHRAMPTPEEITQGERILAAAFKQVYPAPAHTTVQAKAELGSRFLLQGIVGDGHPGLRFVLLREAAALATAAGDVATAMTALRRTRIYFGGDAWSLRWAALETLTRMSLTAQPHTRTDVAQAYASLIGAALAAGDFALASSAIDAAAAVSGDFPPLKSLVNDAEVTKLLPPKDHLAAASQATARVRGGTGSASDKAAAASHRCLHQGDWERGLPALAEFGDAELKSAAAADLAIRPLLVKPDPTAQEAQSIVAAGDRWWTLAEKRSASERRAMKLRAADLYRQALPGITDNAIRQTPESRVWIVRDATKQPGLICDLYDGVMFNRRKHLRVDGQIRFDWGQGRPDPRLSIDDFSAQWSGWIKRPTPGQYQFEARSDEGSRLRINGKELQNLKRDGKGIASGTVQLSQTFITIELDYFDSIGDASIELLWKPPGAAHFTPVPASALWHEPIWPWDEVAAAVEPRPRQYISWRPEGVDEPVTLHFSRLETSTWHAARRRCQRLGGTLATIHYPGQHEFFATNSFTGWLGGSDELVENRWEWTDGTAINPQLFEWDELEPGGGRSENFLLLTRFGWNDKSEPAQFICQWRY